MTKASNMASWRGPVALGTDVRGEPRLTLGGVLRDRSTWLVAGVAFGVRAIWVLAFARIPSGLSDPFVYHGYGLRIAAGRGYQSIVDEVTSYFPPGYPYFLGGVYWTADRLGLDGQYAGLVGLSQSVLWAVACVAVLVAARSAFDRSIGIVAGLVLACWPNLITYAGAWLSESLFACLLAVALAGLTLAARRSAVEDLGGLERRWLVPLAVAAVALGAATMVRPQVLLGLPLVAVAWLVGGIGWKRTLALAAVVSVGVAVFVVPWAIRNDGALGEPVLVSTNGGDNLCVGFHPGAPGAFRIPEYCQTGEFWTDGPQAELRRNSDTRELAIDHIRSEPLSLPWLSLRKLYYTYRSDDDGLVANESYGAAEVLESPWRGTWLTFAHIAYVGIMFSAVVGLGVAGWRARGTARATPPDAPTFALIGMCLAGIAIPMLVFGDPRFKVPVTPLFAVFAAVTLVAGARRLSERRS